jgi:peptide methionine sulfoxide reductase MsrB
MSDAICRFCGEDYPKRRMELGYLSCLDCGEKSAEKEKAFKAKCTAPAFNKGAYTYISNTEQVKGIFKCGDYK